MPTRLCLYWPKWSFSWYKLFK